MNRLFLLALCCISLGACETAVNVDLPIKAPRLVANAFINPDSLIYVRLSKSKFVLDKIDLQTVEGATARILENGQMKEQLQDLGNGLYVSGF